MEAHSESEMRQVLSLCPSAQALTPSAALPLDLKAVSYSLKSEFQLDSFIHPFGKYLSGTYYVLGPVPEISAEQARAWTLPEAYHLHGPERPETIRHTK